MVMSSVLGQWLEPVITPDVARRLVSLKPDPKLTNRVLELGAKANEGLLTAEERAEYEAYISANDVLAILQSQARQVLRQHGE